MGWRTRTSSLSGSTTTRASNVTESRLHFRTVVAVTDTVPFQKNDNRGLAVAYGFIPDFPRNQELGHIVVAEDKCVACPNVYQHRVDAFELADPSRPGYCKVLALFLVNPSGHADSV